MNFIKKFVKKNVNEVLKEENIYTIRKEELCYLLHNAMKVENELSRMQLIINRIMDHLDEDNYKDRIEYDLVCLLGDLQINEARMKDFLEVMPNPYKISHGEV